MKCVIFLKMSTVRKSRIFRCQNSLAYAKINAQKYINDDVVQGHNYNYMCPKII